MSHEESYLPLFVSIPSLLDYFGKIGYQNIIYWSWYNILDQGAADR